MYREYPQFTEAQNLQTKQYLRIAQTPPQEHRSGSIEAQLLIGRRVKINRGGPDSVEGRLLAVNGDVLVMSSQNTLVYVNGHHVKSITEGTSKGKSGGGASGGRSISRSFNSSSSFHSLLNSLRHQFVQINRGGPEKLDGFLAEISSDFILLVVGRERVRIPIFHIKTVNIAAVQNENQSGGSRSGGSGGNQSGKGSRSGRRNRSGNRNRSGHKNRNRSGRRNGR